jgi:uncharacterized Ntn-hydrolase superfamily protein
LSKRSVDNSDFFASLAKVVSEKRIEWTVTLSMSGRCERTGTLGIVIASSSMSVAARCAHAKADIGVCATQNITDPRIGLVGLSLLEKGLDVEAALRSIRARPDAHLGDRLLAALQAGVAAGGEAGPLYSARVTLVGRVPWPIADLRVDYGDDPTTALGELWSRWRPQMDDYVMRALNPSGAPRFGVPGEGDA